MPSPDKGRGSATKTGKAKPRAGRKSGMVKVAAAAGLPFRERLDAFMFGEAAHLARQCNAINMLAAFARVTLPDSPWGDSWKARLQAARDFLGEWLAHATPADLRILADWRGRPNPSEPVHKEAFLLAQMAFAKGAVKVEGDRVWFEQPSSFLARTPSKEQAAWVDRVERRHQPTRTAPKAKAERLEAERLEAEAQERLRDRIRKTAEKLGAKPRPRGRPPENGTFSPQRSQ